MLVGSGMTERERGHLQAVAATRLLRILIAVNLVAVCLALAAIAVVPTGSRIVLIVSPWSEPSRVFDIVADADGSIVASGSTDWILVVEGSDPDFPSRLMASGALMVLDGRLAEACLNLGELL